MTAEGMPDEAGFDEALPAGVPLVVNIGRPGLGPQFVAEMHRLAGRGLVILEDWPEVSGPTAGTPVEVLSLSAEGQMEEDPEPVDESFAAFLDGEPPISEWVKAQSSNRPTGGERHGQGAGGG